MKKWLIGIVLLLGVLIAAKQLSHNDYTSAKKLAEAGNYQAFYTEIKADVTKGDEDATDLLMLYFLKAVQDGNLAEAKYYLDQNKNIINQSDKDGARAMDAAFVAYTINIDMIKFLLTYQPELNYEIPYFKNMSLLQMVILNSSLSNGSELVNLLIDNGASVNFHSKEGEASNSALLLSYSADNFEIFKILIRHGALIKEPNMRDDKHDLLGLIAGSYVLELQKYIPKIKAIYAAPLSQEVLSIIQSSSYRTIHSRNMAYLNIIVEAKKLNLIDERGLLKLTQYFAATNEVDGMKLLVNHGLCSYNSICADAIEKALLNNNRAIVAIIKQGEK